MSDPQPFIIPAAAGNEGLLLESGQMIRGWREQGAGVPNGATRLLEIRHTAIRDERPCRHLLAVVWRLSDVRAVELIMGPSYGAQPGHRRPRALWTLHYYEPPNILSLFEDGAYVHRPHNLLYCERCGTRESWDERAIISALANRRRVTGLPELVC